MPFPSKSEALPASLAIPDQVVPERPNLDHLTDRQLSNVIHGRAPDDDGEFTASSMGAAQDALAAKPSIQNPDWNAAYPEPAIKVKSLLALRFESMTDIHYDLRTFAADGGAVVLFEVSTRPIAMLPSKEAADRFYEDYLKPKG